MKPKWIRYLTLKLIFRILLGVTMMSSYTFMTPHMASASNSTHTIYPNSVSGTSSATNGGTVSANLGYLVGSYNIVVTHVKYEWLYEGSSSTYYSSVSVPTYWGSGAGSYGGVWTYDGNNSPPYMPSPYFTGTAYPGQVIGSVYDYYVPSQYQVGNLAILTEYCNAYLYLKILQVDYIQYDWDNITPTIDATRNVEINLSRAEYLGYNAIKVVNTTNNTTFTVNSPGSSYTITDTGVIPEKYYTYNVYSLIGVANTATYTLVGTYTIEVPSDATYAMQAAQAAQAAAQGAQASANNASIYAQQALNWLNGSTGGFNLGTVGQNATNAMNNSATTNGYLTNETYGLSQINANVINAQGGVNSLQTTANNIQSGVNNLQTSANNIQTGINNLQSSVNNLQTSVNNITNVMPPILTKVSGYNNASATSSTSFNVSLDYTNANEYSYMIDGGGWSTWTSLSSHDTLGYFTASGISGTGPHTIYVQIRNNVSGQISPVAKGKISIFKL